MKPISYMYIIKDEYHCPVSIANSKQTAQKQLEVLAKFVERNRHWKIKEQYSDKIVFENYNFVDIVCVPYVGTKKQFMKHFDFVEDYSNIKSALEL